MSHHFRCSDVSLLVAHLLSSMASLETLAATIQVLDKEMAALDSRLEGETEHRIAVKALIAGLQEDQRLFASEHAELATQTAELECQLQDLKCLSTSSNHAQSTHCAVQVGLILCSCRFVAGRLLALVPSTDLLTPAGELCCQAAGHARAVSSLPGTMQQLQGRACTPEQ